MFYQVCSSHSHRDPVFFLQFEKLRALLFPEGFPEALKKRQQREKMKQLVFRIHNLDPSRMKTTRPFFYEDYQYFFDKILKEGTTFYWEEKDRDEISAWLFDTLIFEDVINAHDDHEVKSMLSLFRCARICLSNE